MIRKQESLPLSSYDEFFDLLVPKDNMLRQMRELVDFEFVYEALKDRYCPDNGREAVCPIRLFKYLLIKIFDNLSDEDVVKRSQYDMSYRYFLEMPPEEKLIDPSTLTNFRKYRLKDSSLLDELIGKTLEIAREQGIIKSKTIIVDSTHTKSRYNKKALKEMLRQQAKLLRKHVNKTTDDRKNQVPEGPVTKTLEEEEAYCQELIETVEKEEILSDLPKIKEKLNLLKETLQDCHEKSYESHDKDARVGYKDVDHSFFGYKTHIAMLEEERLITAVCVTGGEQNDGKMLPQLVEKTRNEGIKVSTVIGDAAYSGKDNLILAQTSHFQLVSKLNSVITHGTRKKEDEFEYNKDAGMFACKGGHLSTYVKYEVRKGKNNPRYKYHFDVKKCQVCPFKKGCYKEGAKSKTYSVTIQSDEHQAQAAFQETEEFKKMAKQRYQIEAKNSELKNRHGYDVAKTAGLFGMEMQSALTIFAVNLKRILKLMNKK